MRQRRDKLLTRLTSGGAHGRVELWSSHMLGEVFARETCVLTRLVYTLGLLNVLLYFEIRHKPRRGQWCLSLPIPTYLNSDTG